jgi:shikimate dehydrogenase
MKTGSLVDKPLSLNLGLIGYPLGHSLSPLLHKAALRAADLEGEYRLYPVPPLPEGETILEDLLQQVRFGRMHGLNITIPHKESVLGRVDYLTPSAWQIGAVNILYRQGNRLVGDNTDGAGFLFDVRQFLASVGGRKGRALVLGSGGSARAVVYALLQDNWPITVAARRVEQAQILARHMGPERVKAVQLGPEALCEECVEQVGLVVNATPLGMAPRLLESPWPYNVPLPPGAIIYDLIYNPVDTVLTRTARAAGLPAVTGLGMLIEQAALSFERWTGRKASRAEMRQALAGSAPRAEGEGR